MTNQGFQLRRLVASGLGLTPAELAFGPGLTVIAGLSETGKSYAFQCIDFMLGAKDVPKSVVQGAGYSLLDLEIERASGQTVTIRRPLAGGDFQVFDGPIGKIGELPPRTLKAVHRAGRRDSISAYLLEACGIDPASKVRKNVDNETVSLTFRLLAHFFLIDENQIIAPESPIATGAFGTRTVAVSAFDFLLTGHDDRALIASEDKDVQRAAYEARVALLDKLISDLQADLEARRMDLAGADQLAKDIDSRIQAVSDALETVMATVAKEQRRRSVAFDALGKEKSREIVLQELLSRFALLRKHYLTDLDRLGFVSEGSHFFGQLQNVNCPLCGTALDEFPASGEEVVRAREEEAKKIRVLLKDLDSTVESLTQEAAEVGKRAAAHQAEVTEADGIIREQLKPQVGATRTELDGLFNARRLLSEAGILGTRLAQLVNERAALEAPSRGRPPSAGTSIDTKAMRELCDEIQRVLVAWRYPALGVVEFDERDLDFIIAGRKRTSHGKGLRAIIYAAFAIGLMRYCRAAGRPHPGFVVLDSPLTTYRGSGVRGGQTEDVTPDMQVAFFESVAQAPAEEQIIVFENKEPPKTLRSKIGYTHFSGQPGQGRAGFYPARRDDDPKTQSGDE